MILWDRPRSTGWNGVNKRSGEIDCTGETR